MSMAEVEEAADMTGEEDMNGEDMETGIRQKRRATLLGAKVKYS